MLQSGVAAPLYFDVWRRGGIAVTHELLGDGHDSHELTASVRSGELVRVRQGHYACPTMSSPEIEAYRIGGRLTGLSAARHYGLWAPPGTKLEVSVHPDARALRSRSDKSQRLHAVKATTVRIE